MKSLYYFLGAWLIPAPLAGAVIGSLGYFLGDYSKAILPAILIAAVTWLWLIKKSATATG